MAKGKKINVEAEEAQLEQEVDEALRYLNQRNAERINSKNDPVIKLTKHRIQNIFYHSDKTKIEKKSGKRLVMVKVGIPSANFRNQRFGFGKSGLDLDDIKRPSYIQLPSNVIKLNCQDLVNNKYLGNPKENEHFMFGVPTPEQRANKILPLWDSNTHEDITDKYEVRNIYFYANYKEYSVRFDGKYLGDDGKGGMMWENCNDTVLISPDQLAQMFVDEQLKAVEKKEPIKQINKANAEKAKKAKEKVKTKSKAKTTKSQNKEKKKKTVKDR